MQALHYIPCISDFCDRWPEFQRCLCSQPNPFSLSNSFTTEKHKISIVNTSMQTTHGLENTQSPRQDDLDLNLERIGHNLRSTQNRCSKDCITPWIPSNPPNLRRIKLQFVYIGMQVTSRSAQWHSKVWVTPISARYDDRVSIWREIDHNLPRAESLQQGLIPTWMHSNPRNLRSSISKQIVYRNGMQINYPIGWRATPKFGFGQSHCNLCTKPACKSPTNRVLKPTKDSVLGWSPRGLMMKSHFGEKLTKRIPNSIAPKRIPHLGESRPTAWGIKNMVIGLKRHGTRRADTISTLTGAVARQPAQPLTGAIKGEAVKLLLILSRATEGVER